MLPLTAAWLPECKRALCPSNDIHSSIFAQRTNIKMLFKSVLFAFLAFYAISTLRTTAEPTIAECNELLFGQNFETNTAIRILNTAIEFLRESSRPNRRSSFTDSHASRLIELMTSRTNFSASTNESPQKRRKDDEDFCELEERGGKRRRIAETTMRIILAMAEKNASVKTIQAKYRWYQPYYLDRFRKCIAAGESRWGTSRYAWRHVDPDFSQHELTVSGRPQMTQNLQFSFHPGTRCEHGNCTDHAFVQCAHCGKLLCLHHFLERVCFHEVHEQELDQMDLTIQGERPFQDLDEEEEAFDESFALFSQDPLQNQSSSSTSSSTVNSLIYRAPFRLSESHKRTN